MRGRTCSALIFLLLLSAQSRAETACVDLAQLAHSTVGITRYFDEAERNAQSDVVGIHGTAWFQSPTIIVTVGHVASGMKLSTQEWKSLKLEDGADSQSISVRIRRLVGGGHAEKLAVLELQTAVSPARSVAIRMSPLVPEDRVVTFAYPEQRPRTVAAGSCNMRTTAGSQAPRFLKSMKGITALRSTTALPERLCSTARAGSRPSSAP